MKSSGLNIREIKVSDVLIISLWWAESPMARYLDPRGTQVQNLIVGRVLWNLFPNLKIVVTIRAHLLIHRVIAPWLCTWFLIMSCVFGIGIRREPIQDRPSACIANARALSDREMTPSSVSSFNRGGELRFSPWFSDQRYRCLGIGNI
jgi:hypothetical protein